MLLSLVFCLFAAQTGSTELVVGEDIPLVMERGSSNYYSFSLNQGERIEGGIWQQSVDVSMSILDGSGETLEEFDYHSKNVDPIRWEAPASGDFLLEVRASNRDSVGRAILRIAQLGAVAKTRNGAAKQYLEGYFDHLQGTQVAVVEKGDVLFLAAGGLANLEYEIPMTLETPCRADIVLRQMTDVGILRMIDAGKVGLNTPLHQALPGFPQQNPPILVRHLLRKETGLSDPLRLWRVTTGETELWPTEDQQFAMFRKGTPPLSAPGEGKDSHDASGLLARQLIAAQSGGEFVRWVERGILKPLEMTHSTLAPANTEVLRRAKIYGSTREGELQRAWLVEGTPTLFTTMDDWILWLAYFDRREEGTPSYWQRLQAIGSPVESLSFREQAGFLYDEESETWFLELRNAIYLLYPYWAIEILKPIFLEEAGWAMEHPGTTMGLGGRGGRGRRGEIVSAEDRAKWLGHYQAIGLEAVYHIRSHGGPIELWTASGQHGPLNIYKPTGALVKFLNVRLVNPEFDSGGPISSFEVAGYGIGNLKFERIPPKDDAF